MTGSREDWSRLITSLRISVWKYSITTIASLGELISHHEHPSYICTSEQQVGHFSFLLKITVIKKGSEDWDPFIFTEQGGDSVVSDNFSPFRIKLETTTNTSHTLQRLVKTIPLKAYSRGTSVQRKYPDGCQMRPYLFVVVRQAVREASLGDHSHYAVNQRLGGGGGDVMAGKCLEETRHKSGGDSQGMAATNSSINPWWGSTGNLLLENLRKRRIKYQFIQARWDKVIKCQVLSAVHTMILRFLIENRRVVITKNVRSMSPCVPHCPVHNVSEALRPNRPNQTTLSIMQGYLGDRSNWSEA